jgi:predicted nucleic acid-binding protein
MYLLDTNVVSELRRPRPHGAVVAWIESVADAELHLSAVTLGEIQAGIEITRERDEAKASEIENWLEQVAQTFNILDMDAPAFRSWARLMHRRSDEIIEDAMIAATAAVHNLTVVTRNIRDFETLGVPTLNPFETPGE